MKSRNSLPIPLIFLFAVLALSPLTFAGSLDLPAVEISATSVAFGNQVVDSRSQPKTVLLLNRGSSPLNIRKISASGDFAVESDCGSALDPGHGCTLVMTFSPSFTGAADGKLTIEDDSKSSPHVITLSGMGVLPLTITPSALRFAPRTLGTAETASVTVTNNQAHGIRALRISVGPGFSQSNTCTAGIAAGQSCQLRITFRPASAGEIHGKLTATDGINTQAVMMVGTGLAPAPNVSHLQITAEKVPAVTAKGPVIPPTPAVPSTLSAAAPAATQMTPAPEIIMPPPAVPSNLPEKVARNSLRAAVPAIIPPPPTTSALPASLRPASANPAIIPPPPATSQTLSSTPPTRALNVGPAIIPPPPGTMGARPSTSPRPLVQGTPAVISPPPSTSALAIMAKDAGPGAAAVPPPVPPESTALVATAKPPADTRAVHAVETPTVAQSDSAPAAIPLPASTTGAPAQQLTAQPAPPPAVAASIPPAIPREVRPAGPRLILTVGLKGTATGTVTSSVGAIRCGSACQDSYGLGEKVVLVPQSQADASFAGWRGCDSVAGDHCTVIMDRNKSVTAIFVRHYDDLSPE